MDAPKEVPTPASFACTCLRLRKAARRVTQVYDGHWTDAGTVPSLLRAATIASEDDDGGRLAPPPERPA